MFTIARLTFLEVLRKKVFFVTAILSVAFVFLYGLALDFTAQEMLRMKAMRGAPLMMQQMIGNQLLGAGLYFSSFLIALLSMLASVGSISAEIENGLLHAIVSKPMRRREIILGKFLGYGSMLSVYAVALYLAVLALNSHYHPGVFSLATTRDLTFGAFIFVLQPLVILGVALVLSTVFRTLTAGIVSIILYGLGMVGGFLEQIGSAIANAKLVSIGIATSLLMPSDALYRKIIAVVTGSEANPLSVLSLGPFGVSAPPSNAMLVYVMFYVLISVGLAMYIFERKDL
ncbi:MAG: ABC transporter permease subunit [Bacillota bacterium]|nr:ABC transporter permease [Bacillota bacterium]